MQTTDAKDRTFVIERNFNAPKELVFEMFTKEEHLQNWYGPKNWTIPVSKLDLREGGSWLYCMEAPQGDKQQWGKFEFQEITPSDKLVYTECMTDPEGNPIAQMPKMLLTLSFESLGDTTKLTNSIEFESVQVYEMSLKGGMNKGFEQAYDKIVELLKTLS